MIRIFICYMLIMLSRKTKDNARFSTSQCTVWNMWRCISMAFVGLPGSECDNPQLRNYLTISTQKWHYDGECVTLCWFISCDSIVAGFTVEYFIQCFLSTSVPSAVWKTLFIMQHLRKWLRLRVILHTQRRPWLTITLSVCNLTSSFPHLQGLQS